MTEEERNKKRVEEAYWRLMEDNPERIGRINGYILHKIEYYYHLLKERDETVVDSFREYVEKDIEETKKYILRLIYDNYEHTKLDDRVFEYLYDVYKDNEEALMIVDEMKSVSTGKIKK